MLRKVAGPALREMTRLTLRARTTLVHPQGYSPVTVLAVQEVAGLALHTQREEIGEERGRK